LAAVEPGLQILSPGGRRTGEREQQSEFSHMLFGTYKLRSCFNSLRSPRTRATTVQPRYISFGCS
jgi:hypothetical protein